MDSLGQTYHQLGDHSRAIECYQYSLELCRALGNRYYEANGLVHLGDVHAAAGDLEAARRAWKQALEILEQLGMPRRIRCAPSCSGRVPRVATVLLLRHGRTHANAEGGLAGRAPVGLDEVGRAQAAAVGDRLHRVPLAAVVTSPLPRCRETVQLALPELAASVDDRLTECGYGDWQGRPLKELAEDPLWSVVQQHPSAARFPGEGGESMAQMAARAVAAIREWDSRIAAEHGPHAVWLACSHGDVIKSIVADALGLHLDLFQRLVVDPASVTAIRYTPTRPFLLRLGDTGELRFEPPPEPPAGEGGAGSTDGGSDAAVGGGAGGGSFGKVEA